MAKPTNHLRILAPPEPDSPPLKPSVFKPNSSDSMPNHSTSPDLESAMAAPPRKLPPLSNHIPFFRIHGQTFVSSQNPKSSNPPPVVSVSSRVKPKKPYLQKLASDGDEKLSKICEDLGMKKFFDEKKEVNEEKSVENKELKEPQKGLGLESLRPTVCLLRKGGRRKSFAGSVVELADIFGKNGVKVVSVDMPPAMQIHAVDCARKAHDSMEKFTSKTLALSLKREFDGVYGPAWHCIVGTSFGSFVTHSVGGFLYFSMDQKLYVLLFKTSVQRAD